MTAFKSQFFQGWIRHRRYLPKKHTFFYTLFLSWLDLEELNHVVAQSPFWSLERFNLVSFYRRDYMGNKHQDLSDAVKLCIKQHNGESFNGRICLLTHLRFLGLCFNPVSFYFCFPEGENTPRYILADIHNTPWNERYCYVLDTSEMPTKQDEWQFEFYFDKAFHVSPFMPMDQQYRWQFSFHDANLTIHMQLEQENECCFDATLQLKAEELSPSKMIKMPLHYPFMPLIIIFAIYWHALRLWIKGIPFYSHPDKKST